MIQIHNTTMYHGNCLDVLPLIHSNSIDAIITDPPYAEVDREYGRLSELEWWDLMMPVMEHTRRVLKPTGSAVFIIQPNSSKCGSMRPWFYKFLYQMSIEYNIIQDVWWWNFNPIPTGCATTKGLLRGGLKACVWCGLYNAYRNQNNILLKPCDWIKNDKLTRRGRIKSPSGQSVDRDKLLLSTMKRGGSTPMNVLPISNGNSVSSGGAFGHGAATPSKLIDWWLDYIVPDDGIVLDPFMGSGTTALSCQAKNIKCIGIERDANYFDIAVNRLQLVPERLL